MWFRNLRTGIFTAAVLALSLASLAPPAHASYQVDYSGNGLSASALFDVVNVSGTNYLQLDLTSTTAVKNNGMFLTAVYFSLDGQTTALTGYSANVMGTNQILPLDTGYTGPTTATPIDVSGEFAYAFDNGGIGVATNGKNGVGSTGLNVFPSTYSWTGGSNKDLSPGGKIPIDGGDFSLVGSIAPDANKGLDGPVIESSARFLFSGIGTGFDPSASSIPLVKFNFGTTFAPVPEPVYVQLGVLFGLATIGSSLRAWRGRKNRFAS